MKKAIELYSAWIAGVACTCGLAYLYWRKYGQDIITYATEVSDEINTVETVDTDENNNVPTPIRSRRTG